VCAVLRSMIKRSTSTSAISTIQCWPNDLSSTMHEYRQHGYVVIAVDEIYATTPRRTTYINTYSLQVVKYK
jgi:hypothetical protein